MSGSKDLSQFASLARAALLGAVFFFLIIGVSGLQFAIGGLLVFVVGAVLISQAFPAEGAEP
jgi:cytochrome b subunit of formate dehydrogenase